MFCPSCGRDDSHKRKFCPACGTNLEAISHALSDEAEGTFSKLDQSLNKFIARYAEHVFKDAPIKALDKRVGRSWQILGQGVLTSLFDLALFTIMTVLLPFSFLILLIRTPIKLLSERGKSRQNARVELEDKAATYLPDTQSQPWLLKTVSSVTEHTTVNLKRK
jgi:hypothetical protein